MRARSFSASNSAAAFVSACTQLTDHVLVACVHSMVVWLLRTPMQGQMSREG